MKKEKIQKKKEKEELHFNVEFSPEPEKRKTIMNKSLNK